MKPKHAFLLIACLLTFGLAACSAQFQSGGSAPKVLESKVLRVMDPQVPDDNIQTLSRGNQVFALDMYHVLANEPGNLFISPYSISQALAMTYAGARGVTANEMQATLHFDLPSDQLHPAFNALDLRLRAAAGGGKAGESQKFQLNVTNSMWGQQNYEFLPEFLDLLAMNYGAGLRLVDFASNTESARQAINAWAEKETQEKIKEVLKPGMLTPDTRLALANAIYFYGDWMYPFQAEATRDEPFNLLDGSSVNVPMMRTEDSEMLNYMAGDGYQAIEMPYVGDSASMLLLVPDAGNFETFEAGLTQVQLEQTIEAMVPTDVSLVLPKFKFEDDFMLKDPLVALGMPIAFSDQADFSGMNGKGGLSIGSVIHKTFVAVDEKGTEAAAVTVVAMTESAMPMPTQPIILVVDRPFVFLIRERSTGTILFIGRMLNPQG